MHAVGRNVDLKPTHLTSINLGAVVLIEMHFIVDILIQTGSVITSYLGYKFGNLKLKRC